MDKQSQPVSKIFAILFTVLFIITAAISIFMVNSMRLAFDPEVYKRALSASGVYDRLPELIGEQIVFSTMKNPCLQDPSTCTEEQRTATPAYLASVDTSEWTMILDGLVDSAWLKIQMESMIDQAMIFLTTPGEPLRLDISLIEFKTRLSGDEGYEAIVTLFNALEPCTADELLSLPGNLLNTDSPVNLPLCRPSETVLKLGESAIRDSLKAIAATLPDDTSPWINKAVPGMNNGMAAMQRSLQLLRTLTSLSLILPIALLLIIILLVVRSLKDFLKWCGVPLVSLAVLLFIASLLVTPLVRTILSARVNAVGLAPEWIEVIRNAFLQATGALRYSLNLQAGILLAAGILMLVAAGLIHNRSDLGSTQ